MIDAQSFISSGRIKPRCFRLIALTLLCFSAGPAVTSDIKISDATQAGDKQPASAGQVIAANLQPPQTGADQVLDPENSEEFTGEMYKIGLGWHPTELQDFNRDKFGLVDWVATFNNGKINPRDGIDPKAQEIPPFDLNIMMPSKTGMIEGAYFPHKTHTTWLACESCHIKIFMPIAGSNDLNMSTIVSGKACGVCHGKVAFPLNDCERCHVPQQVPESTSAE